MSSTGEVNTELGSSGGLISGLNVGSINIVSKKKRHVNTVKYNYKKVSDVQYIADNKMVSFSEVLLLDNKTLSPIENGIVNIKTIRYFNTDLIYEEYTINVGKTKQIQFGGIYESKLENNLYTSDKTVYFATMYGKGDYNFKHSTKVSIKYSSDPLDDPRTYRIITIN